MKNILLIITFLIFGNGICFAQCPVENNSFQPGEKISYLAYYNWTFIWIKVGSVYFKVDTARVNDRVIYHFISEGKSFKSHDWFFKVRDKYQSWVDPQTLRPLEFLRKTYEGGYAVNNHYLFDHTDNRIYSFTENSNKPFTRDTMDMPPCTFDVLTAIFYVRTLDYSKCKVNEKIPVTMIIDNEICDLYFRYLGKETIEIKDNRKFNCLKFSVLLVEGTIFRGGEKLFVWVTDDENKVPVMVEAKILVGSIKVILRETEGLKRPLTQVEE